MINYIKYNSYEIFGDFNQNPCILFQSNMTDFAIGDLKGSTRVSKRVPLKRIGQTEDIAASIQFLCGRGGSYITGAILPVSGGINVSTGPSIFGED